MGHSATIIIMAALLLALAYWFRNEGRPYRTLAGTSIPPEDAIRRAIQRYTMDGWQPTMHTERNVSFVKTLHKGFLGHRRQTLTINITADARPDRGSTLDFATNVLGRKGKRLADQWLADLPPVSLPDHA